MADNGNPQPTQAELLAQIAELQAEVRKIAELSAQNNGKHEGESSKNSAQGNADPLNITPPKEKLTLENPFSDEMTKFQMPKNFVLPTALELYKGFGSTSSFEELARSFIDYFAASRIYVHGSDYLGTIKQGQHESLKNYMTRFSEATMEIQDLDPAVHLHALKAGLRPGKFRETIAITKPKTLEEFRERAAGQMEIEELHEAQKPDRQPQRRDEKKAFRSPGNKDTKRPFKLTPKYNTYTRFNTKRENIIKEILNAKIVKPPARAGNYQDQRFVDRSKHCAFHQKFGHTTDDCIVAKDLLERLARQGLLDKYVEGRKARGTNSDRNEYK
ncbi:uncharacterized protein LOC107633959 [Arachis ipaensis]|uniref:uncharacterized protein LOC107633959 n=1 Tax=Arachis ipaensis TaxID=130454 RepID=UPI0007AF267A|nr:uncharacterized protein LOC107633959 [Arachis ipaensis]XP_025640871.1 uncharacterized protein LOC112735555 [Arachis hypogaea]